MTATGTPGSAAARRAAVLRIMQALGEAIVHARIEAARLRDGVEGDLHAAYAADVVLEKTEEMAVAYGEIVEGAAELLAAPDAPEGAPESA